MVRPRHGLPVSEDLIGLVQKPHLENLEKFQLEFELELQWVFLGDSYKIDYSAVVAKSRCVAGIVNIILIINAL